MPRLPKNLVKRGKTYVYRRVEIRPDGKKISRRENLGTDRDLAIAELAKRRSLKTCVAISPVEELSVREAARRWLLGYVAIHRVPKTQKLAAQRVRDYLDPILGHVLLNRLTANHVAQYRIKVQESAFEEVTGERARRRTRRLSVQSVRHILSDLRCLLNWCEDYELIERSPFPRRVLPKVSERAPDRINEADLKRVCSVEEPYGFMCRFLAQTGLRWGEFVRAKTADISGAVLTVEATKTGRIRRVPLCASLREELCGRVGEISLLKHSDSFAKRVRSLSGVKRFHAHQLRHTFACRWLEAGGSLAALQEVLGHSSIAMTQRYARLSEAHVMAEAARIGEQMVTPVVTSQLRRTS